MDLLVRPKVPLSQVDPSHTMLWSCLRASMPSRGTKPDESFYAYKLDLSKAWVDGLCRTSTQWGFDEKWIMVCISTVGFHVNVNDRVIDEIIPSIGLRQEDLVFPISFSSWLTAYLKRSWNLFLTVVFMSSKYADLRPVSPTCCSPTILSSSSKWRTTKPVSLNMS